MEDQTTLENLFVTVIKVSEDKLIGVEKLCQTIQEQDPTFKWETRKTVDQWVLLVYSGSKNTARMRGDWLTTRTPVLEGLSYRVTHRIALRSILREKPRWEEVESIQEYLKRKKGIVT